MDLGEMEVSGEADESAMDSITKLCQLTKGTLAE